MSRNTRVGIQAYDGVLVQNNTISGNTIGLSPSSSTRIIYNNFEGNQNSTFGAPSTLNATYNWWGTTDAQAINRTIYDSKYSVTLNPVLFVPFLTSPNPEAYPLSNPPSNPQPTPTEQPTANPTLSPTETPPPPKTALPTQSAIVASTSPSPVPTGTPATAPSIETILIVGMAVIILLLVFIIVLLVVKIRRRS